MTKAVVIGGGISGLASAYFLSQKMAPGDITVLESSDHFGGTIKGTQFGLSRVETGPDSFITRNPSAVELIEDLKLSDDLISPATSSAFIYSRSRLHPIPGGTVFGAPSNFKKFWGNSLLSKTGQARAALEPLLGRAKIDNDTTVGSFSKKRWGKEVTENLIDPLVGGIHAGSVYQLS
ncbi:MAG: protoporphyrinogen oxidase, partial [Acidimicrobiaceae bacterium]|nr:protoporphyrinogen oxidase [Acidimicrobiaceae bacterium]